VTESPVLAIVGGRLEDDNTAVFAEMKRLCAGRIAILATASGEPVEAASDMVGIFAAHGIQAVVIPIHGSDAIRNAADPAVAARMEACGSVYFTGGDQALIAAAFMPGGTESVAMAALRRMVAAGGLIAGSSAGAACLSGPMILGGTSVQALAVGVTDDPNAAGMALGRGLDFFPHGVVDQHFIRRGRLGRLLVAMRASDSRWGFGVDENTALIVEGDKAKIVGEYGVMVFDLGTAEVDDDLGSWRNVRLSYLDDGDGFDLAAMKPILSKTKKRVRASINAWKSPAISRRNVFGPYAVLELMVRLAEGDPTLYRTETAQAYDPLSATAVGLTLTRERRKSRTLVNRSGPAPRHTMLDFRLDIDQRRVTRSEWVRSRREAGRGLHGRTVSPLARLAITGSSLLDASDALVRSIMDRIEGPVGIIAAASHDPRDAARDYAKLLRHHGIDAEDMGISQHAMPQILQDTDLLERLAAKRTLIFTGGDQRRLVDTILWRGAETPLLSAILHVYQSGGMLVAVSGAASALSAIMVAGGTSFQALRYGVAADAGHSGMIIEEGVGLFDLGIVDQNLVGRNRLGRLIVACAEENARLGFGLCEDSGIIVHGGGTEIEVIGRHGLVLAELLPEGLTVQSDNFAAHGVTLSLVNPGIRFDPAVSLLPAGDEESTRKLETIVKALQKECSDELRSSAERHPLPGKISLAMRRLEMGRLTLDIDCERIGAD
jgi:cyanophycinase